MPVAAALREIGRAAIRRQWWQLALCGVMSMALFQSLSYRAAESTTATNMAIVTALAPLMTALLSVLLLGVLLAQTVQRPLFGRYRPGVSGTA